jgi:energy-coupling factor transport system ATP-binding protein
MYSIELNNVRFYYNKNRIILDDISLKVCHGEIVGIIGPSGEGKTTLLRLINGTFHREEKYLLDGDIKLMDVSIADYGDKLYKTVGTIYQNPDNQIIFTNVVDEIVFGMENHQYTQEQMDKKLDEILDLLDIKHLVDRNPNHLSGGEKQLIVLASILCLDVDILLLDEAFAAVDEEREILIIDVIRKLAKEQNITIVMVEHDMSHLTIADNIYELLEGKLCHIIN